MNNKIKILILVLLALVGPAWGEATSMITFTKLEGGVNKPEANSITFTAYYNNDDSKIQTEDSWNDSNPDPNMGYVAASGAGRVKPDQLAGDQTGQPYIIWMSYSGTSGNQGGNVGTSEVPSSGTGYTNPGNTLINPFILTAAKYLAAPANVAAYAGNSETYIKWDAVSGATGYRVYKRPAAGEGLTEIVFERAGTTSQMGYVDSGITNGQVYNYIVIATDATRRSGHGSEVPVTPTPVSVPTVTGPASGTIGQPITITGSNFNASNTVYINGYLQTASWNGSSAITINASTPTGNGKLVVIRNDNNTMASIGFTANAPDTQPPTMALVPVNGATNVSMTQEVIVTFSEQMNTSTVNYTLSPDPGGKNAVWSNGDKTLTISHNPFTAAGSYTFTITAAKDLAGNNFAGNNFSTFTVINNQGKNGFPIAYLSETQSDNWISVPFQSAQSGAVPIITVANLMNSLGTIFAPQAGDIMTLAWYNNATQLPTNIQRDYDGSQWNAWDPAKETTVISTGEMFIVSLSNGGGRPTFTNTWEISGLIPPVGTVHYPLAYLSETQSENWIATPNSPTVTTHGTLINSITGSFTPQAGDILTLSWYNNTAQVPTNIQRDYDGSQWNAWDPATESQSTILGKPYKVQLSNPGRNTFNVTWP